MVLDAHFGAVALGPVRHRQSTTGVGDQVLVTDEADLTQPTAGGVTPTSERDLLTPEGCMGWLPVSTVVPLSMLEHAGVPRAPEETLARDVAQSDWVVDPLGISEDEIEGQCV